jgi:hypothetical protein
MPTSLSRSLLSEHTSEPIPSGTLSYIRTRTKRSLFSLLLREFEKSEISRATLARRLNMDPALVSRYLGTPANWEYETICDLFFAISGATPAPKLLYPLGNPETLEEVRADTEEKSAENEKGIKLIRFGEYIEPRSLEDDKRKVKVFAS